MSVAMARGAWHIELTVDLFTWALAMKLTISDHIPQRLPLSLTLQIWQPQDMSFAIGIGNVRKLQYSEPN